MSDNELDAELLALAGEEDDSNSETEEQKPITQSKSPSPPRSPPTKVVKPRPAPAQKGVAQRKSGKATGTTKGRARDDSDDEAAQASSPRSVANSLGSGAMSESDEDVAPSKSDDGPLFPVDGKFYSEKDKKEIMAMSEIKREEILAERAGLLERQTQDQHLRRLLQAREKDAADKKKRKAGNAQLEESPRKGTRQKTKANEDLAAYKLKRERRFEERKQEEDRKNNDADSPDHEAPYSEAEAAGDSEVEWDPAKAPATHDEPMPVLRDYERMRVGRTNFAKVCFYPGFDDTIKGCFCRVHIGPDRATGQGVYRMAQIKGFTTGKPYAMEGSNGKPFQTDQYALVAHGDDERSWPFVATSDSKFTDAEFDRYAQTLAKLNLRLPTMSFVNGKLDAISKLLNHVWTDDEITEKLRRSGVLAAKYAGINRTRLLQDRSRAIEKGNEAAIAEIDQQLAALEGPKLAYSKGGENAGKYQLPKSGAADKERSSASSKNRKAYFDQLRSAQLAEKHAERELQEKIARGEVQANPFARVKTKAKIHHDAPGSNGNSLQVPSKKAIDELFGEGSDVSRPTTPKPPTRTNTPNPTKVSTSNATKPITPFAGYKAVSNRKRPVVIDPELLAAMEVEITVDDLLGASKNG